MEGPLFPQNKACPCKRTPNDEATFVRRTYLSQVPGTPLPLSGSIRGPLNIYRTVFIMGEKVKVNKTDRQLLPNWIYTLFKHQILHSMNHFRSWKTFTEPTVLKQQKEVQS